MRDVTLAEALVIGERVRMALSEAGYNPDDMVWVSGNGHLLFHEDLPLDVAWRCVCLCEPDPDYYLCLRHYEGASQDTTLEEIQAVALACAADRPFVDDCGVV